jgi:hypothetical protein
MQNPGIRGQISVELRDVDEATKRRMEALCNEEDAEQRLLVLVTTVYVPL